MTQMVWDLFGVDANTDTPSADGCVWTVASSDGWDAPDQRTQFTSPTGRDGQSASSMYAEGRQVTIKGMIHAPDEGAAWAAYDRVASSMPGLRGIGTITAFEPVPKSLKVVQSAPPRVTKPAGPNPTLTYWLTLTAEYPWKRALEAVTVAVGAGATVSHTAAGTTAAEIEVTLTSAGSVDLTIGALRLRATSLPSGAVLTSGPGFIRPRRTIRSALPANANLFGAIVQPMQWPAMDVGDNTIHQAGSASLSIRYFPTYA